MAIFRFLLIIITLMALAAPPAIGQAVCGDRLEIISRLESVYQEKPFAIGLAGNVGVVEVYVSEEGSWTILLTQPTGVSCLIAAGDNWEYLAPSPTKGISS